MKLELLSKHLEIDDTYTVQLHPELALWLQEKDTKVRFTHRLIVDPRTFLPAPYGIIEFEDDTMALEYKLRWL